MANYNTFSRTNYFKVKDYDKFINWAENCGVQFEVVENRDNKGTYALLSEDYEGVSIITLHCFDAEDFYYDEDPQESNIERLKKKLGVYKSGEYEYYEEHIPKDLAEHLVDDEVAIFIELGKEKLRCLNGFAIAVNSKGETREVTINSIYEMAKELGNVTNEAVW